MKHLLSPKGEAWMKHAGWSRCKASFHWLCSLVNTSVFCIFGAFCVGTSKAWICLYLLCVVLWFVQSIVYEYQCCWFYQNIKKIKTLQISNILGCMACEWNTSVFWRSHKKTSKQQQAQHPRARAKQTLALQWSWRCAYHLCMYVYIYTIT